MVFSCPHKRLEVSCKADEELQLIFAAKLVEKTGAGVGRPDIEVLLLAVTFFVSLQCMQLLTDFSAARVFPPVRRSGREHYCAAHRLDGSATIAKDRVRIIQTRFIVEWIASWRRRR